MCWGLGEIIKLLIENLVEFFLTFFFFKILFKSSHLLDSFSIGDFIRCSTKSSHFSGELIINDVTNGILLLEEYLNNGRSTLHFVKKCGLLTVFFVKIFFFKLIF